VAVMVIGFCESNILLDVSCMFTILAIVVPLKTSINLSSALSTLFALKVFANVTEFESKNALAASIALPEHYINEVPV
jgi:hypothetical protein